MKKEIKEVLGRLYPGENVAYKYRMYRKRKRKTAFLIITAGIVAFVCLHASSRMQSRLKEGLHLYRNEWGEGNYEVILSVNTGTQQEVISYEVKERKYTYQELCKIQQKAAKEIEKIMLLNNKSLSYVTDKLYLPAQLEGYPFTVIWSSSNSQMVQSNGTVYTKQVPEDGKTVTLTARFQYEEFSWKQEYCLRLFPKKISSQDKQREEINSMLEKISEATKEEKIIRLPSQIGTQKILWKEKKQDNSYYFLGLSILTAIAVACAMDNDLYKKDKKRKKELEKAYPEFVGMLQLYLAAGLTIRNAFFKMTEEYKKEKKKKGKKKFLYEEMILACHMLSNGQREDEVYRNWAERCGEIHYKKLVFLLISYQKKGNENLLKMLAGEGYSAWEEQRNHVRKHGEEATTKMLLPMILMFIVVMVLIMMPVYTGL